MSELNNISDQLEAYTEENVYIIKRIAKKNNLTIEQALKAAEIATKEMIADSLFHINKKLDALDYISNSIGSLSYETEQVSDAERDIIDYLTNINKRED